jgi:catechol 2,3-dioxygenase-like lactoylglutathione lyase family enzyme
MLRDLPVHTTLPVSDLARARRFYEETLGFVVDRVAAGGVVYRAANSRILLFPSSNAGTNKATACGFQVTDLAAAVADLKGRGVRFEEYDMPDFKTVNGVVQTPDGKAAWFKDTEGNIIGVVQMDEPMG